MAPLPPREKRHPFLRYQGLEYTDADIVDFKERLEGIHNRDTHRVQVVDFHGMPQLMRDVLDARMLINHHDDGGVVVFREVLLDLDALGTIQFQLGGARRRMSWRQFILALGLHTSEEMELPGPPPSYTLIRDPVLRLFHRMMAYSIVGRSHAPEKVTVTDLFYLRGLDVRSVNIPYLLSRYLRRFVARRKSEALISGGHFVARLAEHFGLLTEEGLQRLTIIAPTLPVINMVELVRLQICEDIDDTWACIALGLERQPDAAAGAPRAAEGAPIVDEGDQAVPEPM
ncbi:hypothetical protein Tco_0237369, partial [Tanacetum coccineum]